MTDPAPHPFTLRQLQYIVAIADLLNFRAAARACAVSQPALSAQVAAVESALGVRLFERGRRGVLVTEAGGAVIDRARALLVAAGDLVETAARAADPFAATLRMGVIPTISPYLLPAVTTALQRRYPRLTVLWTEDKTANLAAALHAGRLDACVLALEADLGEVERFVLATDPFVLASPRGHALAMSDDPVAMDEIRNAPVLLLEEGHCLRQQALAFCDRAGVHELAFRATSLATLVQMVASGAGVKFLPQLALAPETRHYDVHVRDLAAPVPFRTIALVWRRGAARAAALEHVGNTLREAYPKSVPLPPARGMGRARTRS